MSFGTKRDTKVHTHSETVSSDSANSRLNANPLVAIERDLLWLSELNRLIINRIMSQDNVNMPIDNSNKEILKHYEKIPVTDSDCPYDLFLKESNFQFRERIAILIAISPFFSPVILNPLATINPLTNSTFPELGGIVNANNKEFIPTIDTVRFLTTGGKIQNIHFVDRLLNGNSRLIKQNILQTWSTNGETMWNKQIVRPTDEFLALISGEKYEPSYNSNFPASRIKTKLDWDDLILPYDTMKELKEVSIWLKHSNSILTHAQLSKIIKPGFRCLFYGPPGTGKTLTATLLGKSTGLDVYRIDLSMIVSKWVGETEKNLKGIFDQAQNKNWILFFDEADSLFGKRTQTKSSNDRYANQEVAYLLQRIEDFPGLVVLATNMKDNIDEAFSRRFQSMVYFPNPDAETRLVLWKQSLPQDFELEQSIDIEEIADEHEISGGTIINVVRYCVLMALSRGGKLIHEEDLEIGIMRELKKGGKIVG